MKGKQAPGPRGSLLMGNLAEYKADPVAMLLRLQQGWGDIAVNRLGPFVTHALAHPRDVQYVLQENQANYSRGRFYDNFKLFFGDGLLTTEGDFWKRHRRAIQPMVHRPKLDAYVQPVGEAALGLVQRWRERSRDGEAIDVVPEMMHLSLRMLGKMVFNTDISAYAEEVGPAVLFALDAMMPQGNLNDFIPRKLPTPFHMKIWRARRKIDTIINHIVEQHRSEAVSASDLISLLLAARHPDTGQPMTDQEVHDEVMTVFLAGHETTGTGMAWALYALSQHPEVLRRLREELDAVLGGRAPAVEDFARLPYLEQVVQESLRVYPPIWGYTRDLINDDEIGGYHLPAGSSIFVSPYVTHRHPEFWDNPDAFDPEHFAPGLKHHKFAFFPFGGGPRKCIGFQIALMQMRVVVAVAAQHFELHALPGHPLTRGALISLRPLQGIKLILKPRTHGQAPAAAPSREALAAAAEAGCPFAAAAAADAGQDQPAAGAAPQAATGPLDVPELSEVAEPAPAEEASAAASVARPSPPRPRPPSAAAVPAARFVWSPVEAPGVPAQPSAALAGRRIVIVNGRPGTAERLATTLLRACAKAFVFEPVGDDMAAAAAEFRKRVGFIDGIVDLGAEGPFDPPDREAWQAPMRRSVGLLQACYADWAAVEEPDRLFYVAVTWMDGQMGYGDGAPGQPLGGLWAGLAKTLPQELPNCNVRVLDLAPAEVRLADQRIAAELYRWGLFEVGHRDGRRWTLMPRRAAPARPVPPPQAGEVVLVSGGARGIGLQFALAVAERFGATVVLTGRERPPLGNEDWYVQDDEAFKQWCLAQLRRASTKWPLVEIRRALSRIRSRRQLGATLADIAARGLPIHYRVCDVTDAAAVGHVVNEFGQAIRYVVHNAGSDQPVRLPGKSIDGFLHTLNVKVGGFANLLAATRQLPVRQFCNIGSLTGRLGGMTGELDYAAANEALARLGLWAAQQHGFVAKTLVWPTWDGVGMITNLEVTKQYVSPMAVDEGIAHWLGELSDGGSGEVMFMGQVGQAVTPVQIRGFGASPDISNIEQLHTRRHYLGELRRYRPFALLETRHRLDPASAPFLDEFLVDGRPAMLIGMLLEYAIATADWVAPEGFRAVELTTIRDLRVRLDGLVLPPGGQPLAIDAKARGWQDGALWQVEVQLRPAGGDDDVLRATMGYRDPVPAAAGGAAGLLATPALAGRGPEEDEAQPAAAGEGLARLHWRGRRLPVAAWSGRPGGVHRASPQPVLPADLWARPHPPRLALPLNSLEHALRFMLTGPGQTGGGEPAETADAVRVAQIDLHPQRAATDGSVLFAPQGSCRLFNADNRLIVSLQGVAYARWRDPCREGVVETAAPVAPDATAVPAGAAPVLESQEA